MNNVELAKKVWGYLKSSTKLAKKYEDLVAVSISLISENTEEMFVAVRDCELMVEPYSYIDNNCSIEASAETIDKVFSGEMSFDKALNEGYVKVRSGDVAKFKALEVLVPKKTAAKTTKTAAKTETKAKATAKTETKAAPKVEEKPAAKVEAKAETKVAPKAETKTEVKPAAPAKAETKPAAAPAKIETKPVAPATKPAAKTNNKHGKKR